MHSGPVILRQNTPAVCRLAALIRPYPTPLPPTPLHTHTHTHKHTYSISPPTQNPQRVCMWKSSGLAPGLRDYSCACPPCAPVLFALKSTQSTWDLASFCPLALFHLSSFPVSVLLSFWPFLSFSRFYLFYLFFPFYSLFPLFIPSSLTPHPVSPAPLSRHIPPEGWAEGLLSAFCPLGSH